MNYLIPLIIYIIINVAVFCVYVYDKRKAINDQWRVPESTLIVSALFGAIGATLGMIIAHHKTKKLKFKLVYVFCLIHILAIIAFIYNGIITF